MLLEISDEKPGGYFSWSLLLQESFLPAWGADIQVRTPNRGRMYLFKMNQAATIASSIRMSFIDLPFPLQLLIPYAVPLSYVLLVYLSREHAL